MCLGLDRRNWNRGDGLVSVEETKCDSTYSCVGMRRYWAAKMTGMIEMIGVTGMVRTSASLALSTYLIPRTAHGARSAISCAV
jgi:hypothetical protein